mmetsp:Transcript_96178/g.165830  ORF Transcript_96178/g.165830 Transcript_96178/m.165830 type:complete len:427 (-) Transcript_96178:23-1303(-)
MRSAAFTSFIAYLELRNSSRLTSPSPSVSYSLMMATQYSLRAFSDSWVNILLMAWVNSFMLISPLPSASIMLNTSVKRWMCFALSAVSEISSIDLLATLDLTNSLRDIVPLLSKSTSSKIFSTTSVAKASPHLHDHIIALINSVLSRDPLWSTSMNLKTLRSCCSWRESFSSTAASSIGSSLLVGAAAFLLDTGLLIFQLPGLRGGAEGFRPPDAAAFNRWASFKVGLSGPSSGIDSRSPRPRNGVWLPPSTLSAALLRKLEIPDLIDRVKSIFFGGCRAGCPGLTTWFTGESCISVMSNTDEVGDLMLATKDSIPSSTSSRVNSLAKPARRFIFASDCSGASVEISFKIRILSPISMMPISAKSTLVRRLRPYPSSLCFRTASTNAASAHFCSFRKFKVNSGVQYWGCVVTELRTIFVQLNPQCY